MSADDPADPYALRLRLEALGHPADDLPDWAVPLVVRGIEDGERLDWLGDPDNHAGVVRFGGLWRVQFFEPAGLVGSWDLRNSEAPTLRAAIDAARGREATTSGD